MSESFLTGFHAIEEFLKTAGARCQLLIGPKPGPRVKQLLQLAKERGIEVQQSSTADLDRAAGVGIHRGVLLRFESNSGATTTVLDLHDFLREVSRETHSSNHRFPLVVALDSVTDPHNLGAILRSADKMAVDLVILPERRSAQENETVFRSSAGAAAHVPIAVVGNLSRALDACKKAGFWVIGADMRGGEVDRFDAKRALVIVMGSEGKGLGRLVGEMCDELVNIPSTGHVDSFNVSVAAGILFYELRRQQGFPWRHNDA